MIIVDTGPLVALLDTSERKHKRVVEQLQGLRPPFLTADPVLAEACFLLQRVKNGPTAVLKLVRDGLVRVEISVEHEADAIETLMTKYSNVPMSLADACLVRLTELQPGARVFTFDPDFRVYRRHRNKRIDLVAD